MLTTAILLETLFQNQSRAKHWFKNLNILAQSLLSRYVYSHELNHIIAWLSRYVSTYLWTNSAYLYKSQAITDLISFAFRYVKRVWWKRCGLLRTDIQLCISLNSLHPVFKCSPARLHYFYSFDFWPWVLTRAVLLCTLYIIVSMTQLLLHTFAHLTEPSFRVKAKLLPNKKFLGLV